MPHHSNPSPNHSHPHNVNLRVMTIPSSGSSDCTLCRSAPTFEYRRNAHSNYFNKLNSAPTLPCSTRLPLACPVPSIDPTPRHLATSQHIAASLRQPSYICRVPASRHSIVVTERGVRQIHYTSECYSALAWFMHLALGFHCNRPMSHQTRNSHRKRKAPSPIGTIW